MLRQRTRGLLLAAAAIAACGDDHGDRGATPATDAPTTTTTPEPVGGLLASIGTNRLHAIDRGFGLGLRNVGDEPVTVRELQLVSPLFEPVALVAEEVLLMPGGRRFVLPLPFGEARCGDDAAPVFEAVVVVDDGEQLRVPAVEDTSGAIGRLHERECAAEAVLEAFAIDFGDEWVRDGDAVSGELVLEQRRPGAAGAVEDAVGSVVFTIRIDADDQPVLRVDDDDPRASVPVTISADRCDPHALAESKRTFLFLTWVAVDGGEAVPVELEPTGPARAALEDVFATCQGS